MKVSSLMDLNRLLVGEGVFMHELNQTKTARYLQNMRKELTNHIQQIAKSGDLSLIIATEKAIVKGDLRRHVNSPEMTNSLTTALKELAVIGRSLKLVADPAQYRAVDEAHSLPKNRRSGLPYDEARQAMASHHTRLSNLDKSRLTDEEKAVISARKISLKTGANLYATMQASAIGVEWSAKTKAKNHGLSI